MTLIDTLFYDDTLGVIAARFSALFDPFDAISHKFRQDVRHVVWREMVYAFHPGASARDIRQHFIKSFHPDSGVASLTRDEKNQILTKRDWLFGS